MFGKNLHKCYIGLALQVKGIKGCRIQVGRWTDLSASTSWKGQCRLYCVCVVRYKVQILSCWSI